MAIKTSANIRRSTVGQWRTRDAINASDYAGIIEVSHTLFSRIGATVPGWWGDWRTTSTTFTAATTTSDPNLDEWLGASRLTRTMSSASGDTLVFRFSAILADCEAQLTVTRVDSDGTETVVENVTVSETGTSLTQQTVSAELTFAETREGGVSGGDAAVIQYELLFKHLGAGAEAQLQAWHVDEMHDGSTDSVIPGDDVTTGVHIDQSSFSVGEGETVELSAHAHASGGGYMGYSDSQFSWSSSNTGVATVDGDGTVTGQDGGSVTIYASIDGYSDGCSGTVTQEFSSVQILPSSASIEDDQSVNLSAQGYDATGDSMGYTDGDFSWSSSNTGLATVSGTGNVVAQGGSGSTTITASKSGLSDAATVDISKVTASVSAGGASAVDEDGSIDLTADATSGGGVAMSYTDTDFSWSSSDPNLATVDGDGTVTGATNGGGTVTITATVDGVSDDHTITVNPTVQSVTVSPSSFTIDENQTQELSATGYDGSGADIGYGDGAFAWSSSDTGVATVDGDGTVTGQDGGSATITASANGKQDTSSGTFNDVVVSVEIRPSSLTIDEGTTGELDATSYDDDGNQIHTNDQDFTWSSSDTGVATVNENGTVTGQASGKAAIYAQVDGVTGTRGVTVN